MVKTIQFELVSPEEKLVSEPVNWAIMPGEAGEFGAGMDHMSLVASLKPGLVKLFPVSLKDEPRKIFITGGFVDVAGTSCVVLAEEAIAFEKLGSAESISEKIALLEKDSALAVEEADKMRFQNQIDLEKAKLEALAA